MNLDTLGGRKFVLAALALIAATALQACGKLHDAGYVTVVLAALGIYTTGNVGQKVKLAEAGQPTPPPL